jgi:bifunctional NMN adenylyltransferase/nudix hydrolase
MLEYSSNLDVKKFPIGVTVGRFQVKELHEGHIGLLDTICANHKKVIVFLGIPAGDAGKKNPLDYNTREAMIKALYPNVVCLPQKDNRSDEVWSDNLDHLIELTFGEDAILYGSRDSFLPYYHGKHKTIELTPKPFLNGTEIRSKVANEVLPTADFRAGVIHARYAQRPITYPTVDVVAYNDKNQILLAKKANETKFRFVGGFVDRTDTNWEQAASREFREETGNCEIDELRYIASTQINDWRYNGSDNGIMTTLFLGKFIFGAIRPTDDIAVLEWVNPFELDVEKDIMEEHQFLYKKLLVTLDKMFK